MIQVYIRYYKSENGIIQDNENLMFTVPSASGSFPVINPMVKASEDSADSFDFTMEMDSLYYNALIPLRTRIRIEYDGDILFNGRVLTVSRVSIFQTKNVHCEGAYSYLNDTFYEGVPEKERKKISWSDYLNKILTSHNDAISSDDPWKAIQRGNVDFTPIEEERKFEPNSWTQTINMLSSLTGPFGGHMRVRTTNGVNYLDWYKYYWRDLGDGQRPFVEVGKNILDISSENDVDKVFTRLIPIGGTGGNEKTVYIDGYEYTDKNGRTHTHTGKVMPLELLCDLYSEVQLNDDFHKYSDYANAKNNFGVIYKTQSFSDADTQEKLWNYAKDWIRKCYFGAVDSFNVKAVDMHVVDASYPKILVGECVDVSYYIFTNGQKTTETRKLICKSAQYDLFNPENSSYTFGIPGDLLTHNYTEKKQKQGSLSSGLNRPPKDSDEPDQLSFNSVGRTILLIDPPNDFGGTEAYDSFTSHGPGTGTLTCYDPNDFDFRKGETVTKEILFEAQIIGQITLSGKPVTYVVLSDTRGLCAVRWSILYKYYFVAYWYIKKAGYSYDQKNPFLLEMDPEDGDVVKAYMPLKNTSVPSTAKGFIVVDDGNVELRTAKTGMAVREPYDPLKTSKKFAVMSADGETAFYVPRPGGLTDTPVTSIKPATGKIEMKAPDTEKKTVELSGNDSQIKLNEKTGEKNTVKVDGETSNFKLNNPTNEKNTVEVNGGTSTLEMKNPTTEKSSVKADGTEAEVILYDNTQDTEKSTVEMSGKNENIKAGKDQNGNWHTTVNDVVTYVDQDGVTHTAVPGFISAEDFNIMTDADYNSLKTKLLIADTIIAQKVDADEIAADLAYIRNLRSNQIVADSFIRAQNGYFTNAYANTKFETAGGFIFTYPESHTGGVHIERCFNNFEISEANGIITITMKPADVFAPNVEKSFNMASTQFYQDAVEAAYQRGYDVGYAEGGGGQSFVADDIRVTNGTVTDTRPAGTALSTLSGNIIRALVLHEGKYVAFDAYLNGGEPNDRKHYYFDFS